MCSSFSSFISLYLSVPLALSLFFLFSLYIFLMFLLLLFQFPISAKIVPLSPCSLPSLPSSLVLLHFPSLSISHFSLSSYPGGSSLPTPLSRYVFQVWQPAVALDTPKLTLLQLKVGRGRVYRNSSCPLEGIAIGGGVTTTIGFFSL